MAPEQPWESEKIGPGRRRTSPLWLGLAVSRGRDSERAPALLHGLAILDPSVLACSLPDAVADSGTACRI